VPEFSHQREDARYCLVATGSAGLDMVRVDLGRLHCYYRQPDITRAQFAYLAIYLNATFRAFGQQHPHAQRIRPLSHRLR
jgi:hypothetical protein